MNMLKLTSPSLVVEIKNAAIFIIISLQISQLLSANVSVAPNSGSDARFKILKRKYDEADRTYYEGELKFPVERVCKETDYLQVNSSSNTELLALWSDLLHKYSFANEEMVPPKEVLELEKISTTAEAYIKMPFIPLFIILCFIVFSVVFIILIPIIGCCLFHICDMIWSYGISIVYKKTGRLILIWYYKGRIYHIQKTQPELLDHRHFRLPKYLRNQSDTEEFFDIYIKSTNKSNAGGAKVLGTRRKDTSSSSELDIEVAYRDIVFTTAEEGELNLTEEDKKAKRKWRRKLFERAKGRRQSLELPTEDYGSSSSDEETKHNLNIWEYHLKENNLYKSTSKFTPSELNSAKKTLLQELREERQAKLDEIKKRELEKQDAGVGTDSSISTVSIKRDPTPYY